MIDVSYKSKIEEHMMRRCSLKKVCPVEPHMLLTFEVEVNTGRSEAFKEEENSCSLWFW